MGLGYHSRWGSQGWPQSPSVCMTVPSLMERFGSNKSYIANISKTKRTENEFLSAILHPLKLDTNHDA
ncbi:hypothetical protein HRM2_p00030 (plasmid) [Desulforapulum autotrophicum HRM2]|uniref:Uncharacterized protein n=1 Tax=Desulforapulum autotrophicum (strain ATCC 43914 / DSM 3382 / VKM B-1955 / HRM2) TaxID=177437 RepID=C0QMK3_DESAH|nr:hypothetical protein HRM2_p00030 [Desulforapulum autotrophicum HRM2]